MQENYQEDYQEYYSELQELYDEVREKLLERADRANLDPHYSLENESGRETPDGFSFGNQSFSIRDSKIFSRLLHGNVDQLREILDDGELFRELIEQAFGTYAEMAIEKELDVELERQKEAA